MINASEETQTAVFTANLFHQIKLWKKIVSEVADSQFFCFYNKHVKVPTLLKIAQGHQI